jgi:pyruvate/2-oxoglutarate dehydrogenase complex dihydrolipoamide acyltransferase (E2) component
MRETIVVPDLGAPIQRLGQWLVHLGETVYEGDRIVEVLVDAAVFDVAAGATGRLAEIVARPDELLRPGQVLGYIEIDAE